LFWKLRLASPSSPTTRILNLEVSTARVDRAPSLTISHTAWLRNSIILSALCDTIDILRVRSSSQSKHCGNLQHLDPLQHLESTENWNLAITAGGLITTALLTWILSISIEGIPVTHYLRCKADYDVITVELRDQRAHNTSTSCASPTQRLVTQELFFFFILLVLTPGVSTKANLDTMPKADYDVIYSQLNCLPSCSICKLPLTTLPKTLLALCLCLIG
jgi:hypothetical protein